MAGAGRQGDAGPAGGGVLALGPVLVRVGDRLVPPPAGQARALIGALALAGPRGLPAALLAELLWADRAEQVGRTAFDVATHRVRAWLRKVAGDALRLERNLDRYVLAGSSESDVGRFERLVAEADRLSGDRRADALADALALWRGEPLADVPTRQALRPAITQLVRQRRAATVRYGRQLLDLGRASEALAPLTELAEREPLDESAHAVLIELLAAVGRQAEALRRFETLRSRLADELGVSPSPELSASLLRVLRREVGAGHARQPGPADPGPIPAQLPPDTARFTGRAAQVAELDAVATTAARDSVAVSVLTGIGGVGKTTLAVHWAHRVADRFPDGQLHIDLRGYAKADPVSPAAALGRFLRALGVPAKRVPADVDEAAALYRSEVAGKRLLVLLDNARTAEQVRPLLPGTAGSLVLITSRDRLSELVVREGAFPVALDMLTSAESLDLLAATGGTQRIAAEPAAAAELVTLCGNLPLALGIVAAALLAAPGRPLADQVARLRGDRLDTLAVIGDAALSIRAVFDASYRLLSTSDQRLLRLLGIAPGVDITVPAAAALTDAADSATRHALARLVSANLVQQKQDRYTLHDLVSEYAAARDRADTAAKDRRAALARLGRWYLHTAYAATLAQWPSADLVPLPGFVPDESRFTGDHAALAWLRTELPNLAAIAQQAATDDWYADVAWRLADALQMLFNSWHEHAGWLATGCAALDAATGSGDQLGLAAAHLALSPARRSAGEIDAAREHARRGLAASRAAGWAAGETRALNGLALMAANAGDHAGATVLFEQAIEASPTPELSLLIRGNLAVLHNRHGHLDAALTAFLAAIAQSRRLGSSRREAILLANAGHTYLDLGRYPEAQEVFEQARTVADRGSAPQAGLVALRGLLRLDCDSGRLDRARRLGTAEWELADTVSDPRHPNEVAVIMGRVESRAGNLRAAVTWYRRGAQRSHASSDLTFETHALVGLADVHLRLTETDRALGYARGALTLAAQAGVPLIEADASIVMGAIHLARNRLGSARRHGDRAHDLARAAGARPREKAARQLLDDIERANQMEPGVARSTRHGSARPELAP